MKSTTIFVKVALEGICIITSFNENRKVYIHDAIILKTLNTMFSYLKDRIDVEDTEYAIVKVVYDATIFIQEGFKLRSSIIKDVILYSNKKKFEQRVTTQLENIKSDFIFRKTQNEGYSEFMNVFESYSNSDRYNLSIDILADVSRYYYNNLDNQG